MILHTRHRLWTRLKKPQEVQTGAGTRPSLFGHTSSPSADVSVQRLSRLSRDDLGTDATTPTRSPGTTTTSETCFQATHNGSNSFTGFCTGTGDKQGRFAAHLPNRLSEDCDAESNQLGRSPRSGAVTEEGFNAAADQQVADRIAVPH